MKWESTQVRQQKGRASWDTLDQNFKYDWSIAREKYDIAGRSRAGESAFSPPQYLDNGVRRGARLPTRSATGGGAAWGDRAGSPSSSFAQESREWNGDGGYGGGGDGGGSQPSTSYERNDGGGFN
jgi:hypothetical protein